MGLSVGSVWAWLHRGVVYQSTHTPFLAILIAALILLGVLWTDRRPTAKAARFMLALSIITSLLHAQFALLGWFTRYEAYLYAIGCTAVLSAAAVALTPDGQTSESRFNVGLAAGLTLLCLPTLPRPIVTSYRMLLGPRNIYQQQVQMARFVGQFYSGQAVALNDIGAVSWFSDAHVTDLWGLGNRSVFQMRLNNTYDAEARDRICRKEHADVAIIYPEWFAPIGGLPPQWEIAGTWTIPGNVAAGLPTVVFYSTRPQARARLDQSLADFESVRVDCSAPPCTSIRSSPWQKSRAMMRRGFCSGSRRRNDEY